MSDYKSMFRGDGVPEEYDGNPKNLDKDQLWEQYKWIIFHAVNKICRSFPAAAQIRDDLESEGYLTLQRAVELWDPERGVPFYPYFKTSLRRTLYISACKEYRAWQCPGPYHDLERGKGNRIVSMSGHTNVNDPSSMQEVKRAQLVSEMSHTAGQATKTIQELFDRELWRFIEKTVSPQDQEILVLYLLHDYTYKEIGQMTDGSSRQNIFAKYKRILRNLRDAIQGFDLSERDLNDEFCNWRHSWSRWGTGPVNTSTEAA